MDRKASLDLVRLAHVQGNQETVARHVYEAQTLCRARPHNPAQTMQHLAPAMLALRGVCRHESQIRDHQGPCIIRHTAGVGLAFHASRVSLSIQSASHALE
jgi:hypothetical protein